MGFLWGRLLQVRVLVEEGKADLAVTDRWGATPLDEAMRVGSRAIMDYLQVGTGPICPSASHPIKTLGPLLASSKATITLKIHLRITSPPTFTTPLGVPSHAQMKQKVLKLPLLIEFVSVAQPSNVSDA